MGSPSCAACGSWGRPCSSVRCWNWTISGSREPRRCAGRSSRSASCFRSIISIWLRICAALTGSKSLKTRRTPIRRSTASTASAPSARPASTSPPAYAKRFQEGEFRRRVQFMYGGKLQKIRFKYTGPSIEAVLDRLPTAEILSQNDSGWTISAEVFGKGIEMWMRSQGDYIQEIHEKEREQHGKPGANRV